MTQKIHLDTGERIKGRLIDFHVTRCGRTQADQSLQTTQVPARVTCKTCRKLLEQDLREARRRAEQEDQELAVLTWTPQERQQLPEGATERITPRGCRVIDLPKPEHGPCADCNGPTTGTTWDGKPICAECCRKRGRFWQQALAPLSTREWEGGNDAS